MRIFSSSDVRQHVKTVNNDSGEIVCFRGIINGPFPFNVLSLFFRWKKRAGNDTSPVIGLLPSKYPFDSEAGSFWYGFWYAQQCFYVYPAGTVSWISDSIFCSFLYYLCGHFDIFIGNFESEEGNINTREGRKKLVLHHQRLIE